MYLWSHKKTKKHSNSVYLNFPHEGAQMEFRVNVTYIVFHPDWSSLSWQLIMSLHWESEVGMVVIGLFHPPLRLYGALGECECTWEVGRASPSKMPPFVRGNKNKHNFNPIYYLFSLEPSLRAMRQRASGRSFKAGLSWWHLLSSYCSAILYWNKVKVKAWKRNGQ